MFERPADIAGKPIKLVARPIAYGPAPVIHIDILDGHIIIGAARVMPPYHRSLRERSLSMASSDIAAEVLALFASHELAVTVERALHIQSLLGVATPREVVPAYQYPWQVA